MTDIEHYNDTPVSWPVDGIDVNASLTLPSGEGPFPAVIMVAGSGPTDRNWNSPLIPGANGSAALLAQVLAGSALSLCVMTNARPVLKGKRMPCA